MLRRITTALGKDQGISEDARVIKRVDEEADDPKLDRPYLISSAFYLAVILFIGVPIWFYTCSTTRYSIPKLDLLQAKLSHNGLPPKLHLDISVIQFSANDPLADYLRTNLPESFQTSMHDIAYNISWRVRRPTDEESKLFQQHLQHHFVSNEPNALQNLEENLLKIYKYSNRFRLFIYVIEEPNYSAYCNPLRPHTYTLSFDRFVYLCPSRALTRNENHQLATSLIKNVLEQVYSDSVDSHKVEHILSSQMDLLFSLIPEAGSIKLKTLSDTADMVHHIFTKNIKQKFPELKELINFRLITQYLVDLLDDKLLKRILNSPRRKIVNGTETLEVFPRQIHVNKVDHLIHDFEFRLSKHSSQSVHHALYVISDPGKGPIYFENSKENKFNILESHDMTTMIPNHDNKSLVLNMRALIRRTAGLASPDLHKNCLVRRDVFLNRWEIDAVMGVSIIRKLQNTLLSLRSISAQNVGIKIPKEVAAKAAQSYKLALEAIENLDGKKTLDAYRLASKSYELSESAFFDPSLLESLYFPDDLKYAIYCPLFVPLAIPLTLSTLKLLRTFTKLLTSRLPEASSGT